MQLASGTHIPDGLLAANALLSEKLHQGSATSTRTLHQSFGVVISHTSLGISRSLYDGRVRCRYTGKERDSESGNDYFGARYYASSMGRFMSPDWSAKAEPVPYAKLDDPQSLNLYTYAGNNPLIHIDADGHCWPQFLCNFVTEVKNKVFHGEFTTDTTGAKIRQLDRQEAKTRQRSRMMEEMRQHPPKVQVGIVFPMGPLGEVAQQLFFHYGRLADADKFANGLRPGSYATNNGNLTGAEAKSTLALPHKEAPDAVYPVTPEAGAPISGPTPVQPEFGQPGGGQQFFFPDGTAPGTVGTPTPIPPGIPE